MSRLFLYATAVLLIAGCDDDYARPDQCLRPVLFQQCMASLPKGPERIAAAGNDWDEVVGACEKSSYYQSLRKNEFIKPECRAS